MVDALQQNKDVRTIMIFSCDANDFSPPKTDKLLQSITKPVFGGIFPEIISGKEKFTKGTIVAGLNREANIQIIPELSDNEVDYEEILDEKIPDAESYKTMFVFVDGFAKRISAFIDSLFNVFGLEFNYIGGGAGSLSFEQKPCLFTNKGLLQDCAVLALMEIESGIGVSHGWKDISGPYKVTGSDRDIIKTLDWLPAFQVYKQVVEDHAKKTFNDNNFFDIAKGFPFGISKLGTEKVVRDPFMVLEDGSLKCVGEVPEGSFVHILTGDETSLIKAANNALERGIKDFCPEDKEKTVLFMDCISRVLFLEDKFKEEIEAVFREDMPLIGALTIGEIANSGKDYLEFYNKTSVIGVLEL